MTISIIPSFIPKSRCKVENFHVALRYPACVDEVKSPRHMIVGIKVNKIWGGFNIYLVRLRTRNFME